MYKLFYELIQVAIGAREKLSIMPSSNEWQVIYDLSVKQALVGVAYIGVKTIIKKQPSQAINLSKDLMGKWINSTVNIYDNNELLNRRSKEIQDQFILDGLKTCILKGRGVATYYNDDLSMDYVNAKTPNREFDMKHTHLELFPDTIVEVHWWPSMPISPFFQKALRAFYKGQCPIQCNHTVLLQDGTSITAPDAKFEAVHVLYHIVNHFLYEGIGLRQLMDLYFVLVNGGLNEQDRNDVLLTYKRVGLSTIAPAAMWVLCAVFKMDEKYCIGRKDEKLGKVFLHEIEEGGNLGVYSEDCQVNQESFAQRMKRRMKRRIRLICFNPVGVLSAPFAKINFLLWKRKVIKLYNL